MTMQFFLDVGVVGPPFVLAHVSVFVASERRM